MALSVSKFVEGAKNLGFEDKLDAHDDSRSIGLIKKLHDSARTLLLLIEKCRVQENARAVFTARAVVEQPIVLDAAHPMHARWLEGQRQHRFLPIDAVSKSTRWGSDHTAHGEGVEGLLRGLGFDTDGAIQKILHAADTNVDTCTRHPETAKEHNIPGIALINTQGQPIFVDIVANLALSTRGELQQAGLEEILDALPAIEAEARAMPPLLLRADE